MISFTVLMVATNNYVDFALAAIESIKSSLFIPTSGQVLLFTDQPLCFQDTSDERVSVDVVSIPSYGWPEATLLRYEIFEKHWSHVKGKYVIYLDADTKVTGKPALTDVNFEKLNNGVGLVRHPGFYRIGPLKLLKAKTRWGTWETSKQSLAFVPLLNRGSYVCGGVWMGQQKAIKALVSELADRVKIDSARNVMAKWHDESHLNWWKTKYKPTLLNPRWAYAEGYENLKGISPIITVIKKPATNEYH